MQNTHEENAVTPNMEKTISAGGKNYAPNTYFFTLTPAENEFSNFYLPWILLMCHGYLINYKKHRSLQ